MPSKNKALFFFWALISPLIVVAQYFPSTNYTSLDGLSNNAVRALFLDTHNNLWIGTENGVSKFENGTFLNLYDTEGLAHNSCWDICQDKNEAMWFASYGGGVTKFDGKNFKIFTTKEGLPINKTRKVFSFKDKIYVGTEYGISIIDITTNTVFTPKEVFPHFGVFIITDIIEYQNQIYFSALNEGLFKIEYVEGIPKIVLVREYKNTYSLGVFDDIVFSSNKGFLNVLNLKKKEPFFKEDFGTSVVWQFVQDKRKQIFASAWGIFDTNGGLFQIKNQEMIDVSDYFGIDSKSLLNCVYDQHNDFLYVGSKDKGFYQVQLNQTIHYKRFEDRNIIDFEDNIILHQQGLSFSNTEMMLSLKDFKDFQQDYIIRNKKSLPSYSKGFFELNYDIPSTGIQFYGIVKHQKSYWINSNIGIFEINFKGKIAGYVPIHTYSFGFTADGKFFETNPYGGIHIYDDVYKLKINSFSNVPTDIVRTLNANNKTYLLSVFKGLFSYENNEFKSFLSEKIWKEEKLKHITKNSKGDLIISAEFGDVFIVDDAKEFKIIEKISKESIIGNSISFLESYKDFIFIGTEKGINIYKNGQLRLIDKEQGFEDYTVTASKIINQKLFLGTNKGYYELDLEKIIQDQKTVHKLQISALSINNIPVSKDDFEWFSYAPKEIIQDYQHNSFLIDFVANGTAFPNKLKYRYRLKNSNRWSPYSEKPTVFLPYLPHGNYKLEIEVLDLNAGKTTVFELFKIIIKPPFWLSWWFITLSVIAIIGLSGVLIIRIKRKAKEKAIIQRRIAETKLEALLSQMNPHFTFNAMNAIQHYIISNDAMNSVRFIGEFSKLMRKTLENSSKPNITLEEEIDYLKTYIAIENMRFDNRISVEFALSEEVDMMSLVPTMLLQPFVENVFVHAFSQNHPHPELLISFKMTSSSVLCCAISDNGKGISASTSLHQSKGILLAKERLSLLEAPLEDAIQIVPNIPSGTKIVVLLKV
ncbi:hypothetical protein J2X31_001592 [Flavobacterium arsenatis]|uniref:Signal transduction histidine kinase internal region domain-containing protein n=1 Tax=Flavobacterium arsenatis TaxID=1484332 RepID=A0ABU1TNQ2_9FLAO|nr:histidine kinase [Flavobacterium arsenatis]MDR6967580.1 hypothetical protein [Flavobacterium arsenatis]